MKNLPDASKPTVMKNGRTKKYQSLSFWVAALTKKSASIEMGGIRVHNSAREENNSISISFI